MRKKLGFVFFGKSLGNTDIQVQTENYSFNEYKILMKFSFSEASSMQAYCIESESTVPSSTKTRTQISFSTI